MALQVRFLSTRPDTSQEFWWGSTDNEVQGYCSAILTLANNLGISHNYTVAPDGLSCVSSFTMPSVKEWNDLNTQITATLPGMVARRMSYYKDASHTIEVEWYDTDSQRIVLKNSRFINHTETEIY